MRPGVNVTVSDAIPARSVPTAVDTLFAVGVAERGSTTVPTLVRSLAEFKDVYGDRWGTDATLYDQIDAYFREGGQRAYLMRVVGPAAVAASKTINETATASVTLTAKSKGSWGNNMTVEVGDGSGSSIYLIIRYNGVLVETSPEFTAKADLLLWDSDWVTLASGGAGGLPTVAAASSFTSGTDDYASIAGAHYTAALDLFTLGLGPGQVAIPGQTSATVHAALLSHAAAKNRLALLDAQDSSSVSTLTTAASNLMSNSNARYGGVFAPKLTVPGIVPNTLRSIWPSTVVAGMMARLGNPGQPPAGSSGQSRFVISPKYTFTDSERETLNTGGVNSFKTIGNSVRNYGFRSVVNPNSLGEWLQLTTARVVMAIKAQAEAIGEEHLFKQIDGRGLEISRFNGELSGMLVPFYEDGALYGRTPQEAFYVDTGDLVNTPTTIANGELKANIMLRTSPFGEMVTINIVKVPLPSTTDDSPINEA